MRIISYFQETIKEQQATYSSLLIFLGMLLLLVSCQQKSQGKETVAEVTSPNASVVVSKDLLTLKQNIGLYYFKNELFTGVLEDTYNNGVIAEQTLYVEGKRNGLRQKWFPNGLLSFEANYVKGKQHGTSKTWWKNGNLRSISNHTHGVVNGIQEQWYKTGEKLKRLIIVNGKEEGLQQAWRKNGKLYNNYEAKNGRIFGLKRSGLCYELQNEIVQTK
ncbi:toxin-antitoxin system YwqK family antitoxin [Kordia sp.]|uniref:toxin-antitoxin system YwqK family antitoxin n=1 Tax=Kordia sp. TaxID=1965332 RepID=UPI003D6ABAE5